MLSENLKEVRVRILKNPEETLPGFQFRSSGFGFRISGSGFRLSVFGSRASVFGFLFSVFGFRSSVSGLLRSGLKMHGRLGHPNIAFRVCGFSFLGFRGNTGTGDSVTGIGAQR